jgi:hypothetical protein
MVATRFARMILRVSDTLHGVTSARRKRLVWVPGCTIPAHPGTGGRLVTKMAITIALAVALSACASNGQPGRGGPTNVGTNGPAREAVDNSGSTSSNVEAQRAKQAKRNTTPADYFPADPPGYGPGYGPAYGPRYGYGPGNPAYSYGRTTN